MARNALSQRRPLDEAEAPDCSGGFPRPSGIAAESASRCATGSGRSAGAATSTVPRGLPATTRMIEERRPPAATRTAVGFDLGLTVRGFRLQLQCRLRTRRRRGHRGLAEAYKLGVGAVGEAGYTAMQIATILGEHHVKVVPEIAVSGDGGSGMANVMLAKLVAASNSAQK